MHFRSIFVALALFFFPHLASAQEVPAPIHGVSFEEWAAANARLANHEDKQKVLEVLAIDDNAFEEINRDFGEALKNDKDYKLIALYGEAFSKPNSGRFASGAEPVSKERKLKTFDDYARVEGHLQAATKAGIDPQQVLSEHGLNVYRFSQDSAYWVGKLREYGMAGDHDAILNWHATLARYKAQYAARYPAK